jgi:hypothetical protein
MLRLLCILAALTDYMADVREAIDLSKFNNSALSGLAFSVAGGYIEYRPPRHFTGHHATSKEITHETPSRRRLRQQPLRVTLRVESNRSGMPKRRP